MTLARSWKAPAILGLLFLLVAALHLGLETLQPVAQRIESQLLAIADSESTWASLAANFGLNLWLTSKALVFPALVLALTFFAEAKYTQAEREPKNYLTAVSVQLVFFYLAYLSVLLVGKLIPLPAEPLLALPSDAGPAASAALAIGASFLFLITYDVLLYWSHRAHHHIPWLWRFHAIHHCPRDLDALHNYLHPVELLIRYFTIALPLNFIVQMDQERYYLVFTFLALQNQLTHMNVPWNFGMLGKVFVDNRHHFIHHSRESRHFNRNYAAIFSFTDRIFGTFHPAGPTLPETGLDSCEQPVRLRDYLLARRSTAPPLASATRQPSPPQPL